MAFALTMSGVFVSEVVEKREWRLWWDWSANGDSERSVDEWCQTLRAVGFFYLHLDVMGRPKSRVVSRKALTRPLLVVRRGADWQRPSWALTDRGADTGCTRTTLDDERSVLWSAMVEPGGVLAISSNHPDGDKGLLVEEVESKIGPVLIGADSTAELFVDPAFITRVQVRDASSARYGWVSRA